MNDPNNCRCPTVKLITKDGRSVITNDTDDDRVLWASRGYFSAEAHAKMEETSEAKQDPKMAECGEDKKDPKSAETEASIPVQGDKPKGRKPPAAR